MYLKKGTAKILMIIRFRHLMFMKISFADRLMIVESQVTKELIISGGQSNVK